MTDEKDHYHDENTFAAKSDTCKHCGTWLGKGYICDDCEP